MDPPRMRKLPAVCTNPATAARRQHDCLSSTRASSSRKACVKPGPKLPLPLHVTMRHADDKSRLCPQSPGKVLHQDDRPVPPPRAADRQYQPALLLTHESRSEQTDESDDLVQEHTSLGPPQHVVLDVRVQPCERPELRHPVRIGQEA